MKPHGFTSFTHNLKPQSKALIYLHDGFLAFTLIASAGLISFFGLIIYDNIMGINMLYKAGALESTDITPLYLTLVPELLALGAVLLVFFFTAYFYNQLAYSGYRLGIVISSLVVMWAFAGLLSFSFQTFPSLQKEFYNFGGQLKSHMPSQSYLEKMAKICNEKGFYIGWVESSTTEEVTINQLGKRKSFEMDKEIDLGRKVIIHSDCHNEECEIDLIPVYQ